MSPNVPPVPAQKSRVKISCQLPSFPESSKPEAWEAPLVPASRSSRIQPITQCGGFLMTVSSLVRELLSSGSS